MDGKLKDWELLEELYKHGEVECGVVLKLRNKYFFYKWNVSYDIVQHYGWTLNPQACGNVGHERKIHGGILPFFYMRR